MKEISGGLRPSIDWSAPDKQIRYTDLNGNVKVTCLREMIDEMKKDTK